VCLWLDPLPSGEAVQYIDTNWGVDTKSQLVHNVITHGFQNLSVLILTQGPGVVDMRTV